MSNLLIAQHARWQETTDDVARRTMSIDQQIIPYNYTVYNIDFGDLSEYLLSKSQEEFKLDIPLPNGKVERFVCSPSALFSKALQDKFPGIVNFSGKSERTNNKVLKMGLSPKGFHAMILESGKSSIFIDIYSPGNVNYYISYKKSDYEAQEIFTCGFEGEDIMSEGNSADRIASDCMLRTYRLALACTGEYATFHGGTVESVLAEYAIAMNRVNGIYEKDLGITMVLIDNTDELIFLDGTTDPYTNESGGTMLGENQETINNIIGIDNYDIGHVFSTGGGGIASLQSPCSDRRAMGVTGLGSPINDPFYVDYVCHEMGHQFGANHTQNNSCNRNDNTAMEVGSANTIMGYAGICAPNSKNASDDHFHAVSILEVANFVVDGNGSSCGESTITDNNPPSAIVESSFYTLPISTPFMLEVIASDDDGDVLSFCWEQYDNEAATMPPESTNTEGPAFISNSPLAEPVRFFPSLDIIVNNDFYEWEVLPSVSREMNFRCTVRDNNSAVGCTDEADVNLQFSDSAGPFLVMHPNTNVTWNATDTETVTWDVAGTNLNPVNCEQVDILLSTDGGYNYDVVIAENVENNGSLEIIVPDEFSTTARIMVKCSDNVFFDISDVNFTITTPFSVQLDKEFLTVCQGDSESIQIDLMGFEGFDEEVNLTIENQPAGLDMDFTNNPVSIPGSSTLMLNNIDIPAGLYEFSIIANSASISISKLVRIQIQSIEVNDLFLQSPMDGQKNMLTNTTLEWTAATGVLGYNIEVSTSPLFTNLIQINNVLNSSIDLSNLEENTVYYWRVQALNDCAGNPYSEIFAFQTLNSNNCDSYSSENVPIDISDNDSGVYASVLQIDNPMEFQSMRCNVNVSHTWVGDLILSLVSPIGEQFILVDQMGVPASQYGCSEDDLIIQFYDGSPNTADDLENACEDLADNYQPVGSFAGVSNIEGSWTLMVEDVFDQDGGQINEWSIEFCNPAMTIDPSLTNVGLIVESGQSGIINMQKLLVNASEPTESVFTIMEETQQGELRLYDDIGVDFMIMTFGSTFTQEDINQGKVIYQHGINSATEDKFVFDVVDEDGNWANKSDFNIQISQGEVLGVVSIVQSILCSDSSNGEISVEISGGIGPFTYSIDGVNYQEDSLFVNLDAGTYMVFVKDVSGEVVFETTVTLENPDPLLAQATQEFYNTIISATGGTGDYEYSIDGITYQSSSTFNNLPNGNYTLYIRDDNGCISTIDWTVDITTLSIIIDIIPPLCFGLNTGEIMLSANGGFTDYEYSLNGIDYQATGNFENLAAGNYEVWVKDAGNAIITEEITIDEPAAVEITAEYTGGNIEIVASGGMEPYLYSIDGGINFQEQNTFLVDMDGTYEIVVLDANGCQDVSQITLSIVDVEEELIENLQIYPIPFTDKLTIRNLNNNLNFTEINLKVTDMLGREMPISIEQSMYRVDISTVNWPQGQYILMFEFDQGYVLRKIMKY